jgi:type I restriction enzyme S subunit
LWNENTLCIVNAGVNTGDNAILKFKACFPDSIIAFVPNPKKADIRFIKYYLDIIKPRIRHITMGATQDNLSVSKLLTFKIPTPPLTIQKKITAVLSTYDDLIENNNKRIALLEKAAEEIYREWFVRLRFPGWETTPIHKGIPDGWEIKKISDFCTFKYGYTESSIIDDELPKFLRVMDINKSSYISWNSVPNCKMTEFDKEKYKLSRNDIVIARMADPGKVAIIEDDTDVVFASYLIKIQYDEEIVTPYYFFYTLSSRFFQDFFSNANSGATRGSINAKMIGGTNFLVPNHNLLSKFDSLIIPFRIQLSNLLKINSKLTSTRDMLLSRLISGKLPVDDLDIQFPPSMIESQEPAHA